MQDNKPTQIGSDIGKTSDKFLPFEPAENSLFRRMFEGALLSPASSAEAAAKAKNRLADLSDAFCATFVRTKVAEEALACLNKYLILLENDRGGGNTSLGGLLCYSGGRTKTHRIFIR